MLGLTLGAELPVLTSRVHLVMGHLVSKKRAYSTARLFKNDHTSLLSRPFDDFFASPTDTSNGITTASFEPFATRGLRSLLKADLANEV